MRRAPWAVAGLVLLAVPVHGAGQRVNVVTEQVKGVPTVDAPAETATLLVYVVDDAGDPIDEVEVVVFSAGKQVGSGRSDGRGRVLLPLSVAGPVRVRADEAGFVSSVARGVALRRGGLTALVLPLEEAPLQMLPDEPGDEEPKAKPVPKKATPGPAEPTAPAAPATTPATEKPPPTPGSKVQPTPAPKAQPTPAPKTPPTPAPKAQGGPSR